MDINIKLWFRQQGLTIFGIAFRLGRFGAWFNFCYRTDPNLRALDGRFFFPKGLYLRMKGGI